MARSGRPPAISREELCTVAVSLFETKGFAATTVADVASTAGIAKRTFFLYFASKADAFWYESETVFSDVERRLADAGAVERPIEFAIALASSGDVWRSSDRGRTRARYELVDATPELQAASLTYHRRWVESVERFLRRNGVGADEPWLPAVIAATMLAIGNTVTREWAFAEPETPLEPVLERYLRAALSGLLET